MHASIPETFTVGVDASVGPEDDPGMPDMSWLKTDLIEHAFALGLDVDESITKRRILDAIESAD